jgi:cytochrome c oxidase assembly protein subunit 15
MKRTRFAKLSALIALLALAVIMLGAYVRLSNAGLGCPDWPGCYGRMIPPSELQHDSFANQRPLEPAKAWKEMIHRYLAGSLGVGILIITLLAWRNRRFGLPVLLPSLLLALVIFQALLGMWTVTLKVHPAIVTTHLAGGLSTLALLWWLTLRQGRWLVGDNSLVGLRKWTWIGLALLCGQILLGGWTSSNYAALACPDFPTCYSGLWWPAAEFDEGFTLWRELGVDYEFGVLNSGGRTAIHLTHRAGALLLLLYLGTLGALVWRSARHPSHRRGAMLLLGALLLQISLGISNVIWQLPLPLAVAHNGGAALLLLAMISLIHAMSPVAQKQAQTQTTRLNSVQGIGDAA